ncbi:MAG: putative DNA binding domain-containing protein [Gammaproteobacteria bacterium]|nr:putative DNA binding domain-containing protein [Gammaproteobacteria bacterium]
MPEAAGFPVTRQELLDLIAAGEGPEVEFQRSLGREFGRELCAFANGDGGTILLGVSRSGEVVGVGNHRRTRVKVLTVARSGDPPIVVEVESVGEVMRVTVPPQKYKPYSIGWRAFVREGGGSRRLTNAEIRDLYYAVGRAHFDKEPCEAFSMEAHLKADVWERFIGRAKIPEAMHAMLALRNLGLVDNEDRMTYAGAWLLAQDIRQFTESAHVSCAFFRGTEEVGSLERQDFHGSLLEIADEVLAWVLRRINVQFTIWREDARGRPELPEEALREALVNAIAHRDYRSRNHVRVRVFKDRVEIVSPGGLPEGMNEGDLGTKSVPRNPLLYSMLARMGLVGGIGTGIRRMKSLCREYGVLEPRIESSGTEVTTSFRRPPAIRLQPSGIGDDDFAALQASLFNLRDTGTKTPDRHRDATLVWERKTTVQVRDLVRVLDRDRSRAQILQGLGLRNRSNLVVNYLRPALDAGLIEMTIPDKPTSGRQRYRLTPMGRELRLALLERARGAGGSAPHGPD